MKTVFYRIMVIAVVAIVFASCEKLSDSNEISNQNANALFEQTRDPYDYVFINPKWELIDANYSDEFGNYGEYYENANNRKERWFKILIQTKVADCGDGGVTSYAGEYKTVSVYDKITRTYTYYTACVKSATAKNCKVTTFYDENLSPCSTIISDIKN
ncbi:MAG: hypothetical protein LBV69_02215 [Bacteroidales bacterium]|jgi:hypothetical protein|nr:hypothetical protein [Bacteroidales bacterium]